jgi:nicotinic acid mononucleotide adenylyltransferase
VPGSFNPLHHGHWGLAEVAARLTGKPVAYELSIRNVDKPALSAEELRRRLSQFAGTAPLWLTHAPTYVEKARLFPGTCFVIGADTAARVLSVRYYQDSEANRDQALEEICQHGCRFLVAGRREPDGRFLQLADLSVPQAWAQLFVAIPRNDFEVDCSSTRLREQERPRQEVAASAEEG